MDAKRQPHTPEKMRAGRYAAGSATAFSSGLARSDQVQAASAGLLIRRSAEKRARGRVHGPSQRQALVERRTEGPALPFYAVRRFTC